MGCNRSRGVWHGFDSHRPSGTGCRPEGAPGRARPPPRGSSRYAGYAPLRPAPCLSPGAHGRPRRGGGALWSLQEPDGSRRPLASRSFEGPDIWMKKHFDTSNTMQAKRQSASAFFLRDLLDTRQKPYTPPHVDRPITRYVANITLDMWAFTTQTIGL